MRDRLKRVNAPDKLAFDWAIRLRRLSGRDPPPDAGRSGHWSRRAFTPEQLPE